MKTYKEQLVERNKKFHKLSPAKQRVEIAKDVLLQLKSKKYVATTGRYFDLRRDYFSKNSNQEEKFFKTKSAQEAIDLDGIKCEVCARGAIFASRCRLGNDAINPEYSSATYFSKEERKVIDPCFGTELKLMIEYLFELGGAGDRQPEYQDVADRWIDLVYASTPEHRMKLIMKNLIRNNGSLVLFHKTID